MSIVPIFILNGPPGALRRTPLLRATKSLGGFPNSPFAADPDHFPADRQYMLNLRVDDLDGMLATLRSAGIEVTTNPEWDMPSVGRFARLADPDGNPPELWQPDDDE